MGLLGPAELNAWAGGVGLWGTFSWPRVLPHPPALIPVLGVENPEIRRTKHQGLRLSDLRILKTQGLRF